MKYKLLHISANQFPPLAIDHNSKRIWMELAKGFDEYHILARSKDNKFHKYNEGNLVLHLVPKLGNKLRSFIFSSFYMIYLIPRYRITHLLAQSAILGGLTGIIAKKIYKIPLMIEIHGDVYFKYMTSKKLQYYIIGKVTKYVFKNATKVRSLSTVMSQRLNEHGIENNVVVIPNRVDLSFFSPIKQNYHLNTPIKILSVGRFVPQKGYDVAIKSIIQLSKTYNVELTLVGGGPLFESLTEQSKDFPNIRLIKWIEQKQLLNLFRSCDIYIQPSKPYLGEAMPRTILEAMAFGLPIIASNIAAIPGILNHNENAILIQPSSSEALKQAIEKMILDESLRKSLGQNSYKDVCKNYEWNKVFQKYRNEIIDMKI